MFEDIPESYRNQTADNEEERDGGIRRETRMPGDHLNYSHAITWPDALCAKSRNKGAVRIMVYLDISWIKKGFPNAEEYKEEIAQHVSPV
jgi:hypothetical protein